MRDLCRAAADPLIHQDAVTFSLSGHSWVSMRDREDRSASGAQHPIIRWVTDHFNLIPVYQLSVIFLNYRCACRRKLKEIGRFVVPHPPGSLLLSFSRQSESNLPDSQNSDARLCSCWTVWCYDFGGCLSGEFLWVFYQNPDPELRCDTYIYTSMASSLNSVYNEARSDDASGFT